MESQQKAGSQQRTKPFIRSPKGHRDCFHKGGSLLAESYKNCCYSIRGSSHSLTTFGLSCIISSGTAQEPFCDHLQAGLMRRGFLRESFAAQKPKQQETQQLTASTGEATPDTCHLTQCLLPSWGTGERLPNHFLPLASKSNYTHSRKTHKYWLCYTREAAEKRSRLQVRHGIYKAVLPVLWQYYIKELPEPRG